MLPFPLLAIYSLAHFWVDLSCALLLFRTLQGTPEWMVCVLLYNFCAFALQMPLGALADRFDRNGLTAALGCVLVAAAYLLPTGLAMAVTAGMGNALFHLGGGIDVLNRSEKRCAALGVFVSPGALGLYLGTAWGKGISTPLFIGPVVLLVSALLTAGYLLPVSINGFFPGNDYDYASLENKEAGRLMTVPMIVLAVGVVFTGILAKPLMQAIAAAAASVL